MKRICSAGFVAVLTIALLVLAGNISHAQVGTITILSAQPDITANELVLRGGTFPNTARAFFAIDPAVELTVVSVAPKVMRVALPAASGPYSLKYYQFDAPGCDTPSESVSGLCCSDGYIDESCARGRRQR